MIKAIETVYNGYRFRSRLEARWAVYFDALGIRYEYEAEGYDLGAAGYYLPDFWLPDFDCWVEIKPEWGDHSKNEATLRAFNYEVGPIVCLMGTPTTKTLHGWLFCGDSDNSSAGSYGQQCAFAWCEKCSKNFLFVDDNKIRRGDRILWRNGYLIDVWNGSYCGHDIEPITLNLAVSAARSARFEHGEKV